jgi:hypothetical protein
MQHSDLLRNIHMKHLQHTSEISETLEYTFATCTFSKTWSADRRSTAQRDPALRSRWRRRMTAGGRLRDPRRGAPPALPYQKRQATHVLGSLGLPTNKIPKIHQSLTQGIIVCVRVQALECFVHITFNCCFNEASFVQWNNTYIRLLRQTRRGSISDKTKKDDHPYTFLGITQLLFQQWWIWLETLTYIIASLFVCHEYEVR